MTFLSPVKLIVFFLNPHTIFGEKVQLQLQDQPLACSLAFLAEVLQVKQMIVNVNPMCMYNYFHYFYHA
jgi:hypothetical protein